MIKKLILKPFKFIIAKGLNAVTPKSISSKQAIWGDAHWSSLGAYYSTFIKNFALANLKEHFEGKDTKEILYGKHFMYDEFNVANGLLEMPGRSHGYIKSFIKNPEFAFAHEQQMVFNLTKMAELTEKLDNPNLSESERADLQEQYDNHDVTNENVLERINKSSLMHAKWSILMNDNKFVEKFNVATNKGWLGMLAKSEFPVLKIPLNWVGRGFAVKYGLIRAIIGRSEVESRVGGENSFPGIAKLLYKGSEGLTEKQADLLGRSIQLGTMGAAFVALGYFNRKNITKNDDGSYEIFGNHIPKNLVHIPEYESIFSGAEMGNEHDGGESFIKSYVNSDLEMIANNPFSTFLQYGATPKLAGLIGSIAKAKAQGKEMPDVIGKASDIISKKISDMTVPGFVKQTAASYDTEEGKGFHPTSPTIKRYPSGEAGERFWQNFEMSIPGLRKNVATEKKSKDINELVQFKDKLLKISNKLTPREREENIRKIDEAIETVKNTDYKEEQIQKALTEAKKLEKSLLKK